MGSLIPFGGWYSNSPIHCRSIGRDQEGEREKVGRLVLEMEIGELSDGGFREREWEK